MSDHSKIEWTDATWNPFVGCSKISPGCKHCYAIKEVHRMAHNPNPTIKKANAGLTVIQGGEPNWTGKVRVIEDRLAIPLRRRKPTTYFVNSLSDLFHEDIQDLDIIRVLAVMALASKHRYQVLTKRSERLAMLADSEIAARVQFAVGVEADRNGWTAIPNFAGINLPWPLPCLWLGVSVESREYLPRIDDLRKTPAAVRFLSLEPLLEDLGPLNLEGIDWVIVGGESGKDARPMHPDWVRSIRDQCVAAGVKFFFKQWGAFKPVGCADWESNDFDPSMLNQAAEYRAVIVHTDGSVQDDGDEPTKPEGFYVIRCRKAEAGRELDGRTWDEMPAGVAHGAV